MYQVKKEHLGGFRFCIKNTKRAEIGIML